MARAIMGHEAPPEVRTAPASHPYQAYQILHWAFVAAPVIAGLDKFSDILADWEKYLCPQFAKISPFGVHATMMVLGVIEIVAGLVVALKPRIGAWIVAAWLAGIIVDLLLLGAFYDIALRDFGLMLGAIALARLSLVYDPPLRAPSTT